jgi:hypothetical protein
LDTVSRQIFGDIQETQFSGSKMEVNVHLKNAFQAELETEGSCLTTIVGLPPAPPLDAVGNTVIRSGSGISLKCLFKAPSCGTIPLGGGDFEILVPDLEIGYKMGKHRGTKVELISSVKISTCFLKG